MSAFVTGLVFSVCELVMVCTSPIFGAYVSTTSNTFQLILAETDLHFFSKFFII